MPIVFLFSSTSLSTFPEYFISMLLALVVVAIEAVVGVIVVVEGVVAVLVVA
jgi:hypothetical protein